MTKNHFLYIWQYIHLTAVEQDDIETAADEGANDEDVVEDKEEGEAPILDQHWFSKAAPIIELVNEVSCHLCKHPGSYLSIDEIMKLFKGRSI